MHGAVEIHSPDGKRVLAEVKKQLVSLTHGAKVNVTGMQFPLEVKGDFRGKNFTVGSQAIDQDHLLLMPVLASMMNV